MNSKQIKLNKNYEFKRVYKAKFKAHPFLVTYALKNRKGFVRFGITTSKKIGKAHVRNRARRVISAAARECFKSFSGGYDFVFVARTATPLRKSNEIENIMKKHIEKLCEL